MRYSVIQYGLVAVLFGITGVARSADLLEYVDPFIGTGGHGHTFIGASVPFGAIQPGPTNIHKGWDWCSGYHYSDTVLIGFSHLHLNGTGCTDLGDILMMPFTGSIKTEKGTQENPDAGYASRYRHETETAHPNYYSVILDDYSIKAELTATERVALHRYQFPPDQAGHVIIDLQEGIGDTATETFLKQIDQTTFGGYRFSKGWAADQRLYFAVRIQGKIRDFTLYDGDRKIEGDSGTGPKIKGVFGFSPSGEAVLIKVSISPVSMENALLNMDAEMSGWDFDRVVEESGRKWNHELNKIQVDGEDRLKRIFYTALYHTMISPVLFNDCNGDYRGTDKQVYPMASFQNYSVFSLWDTYRALHPLLTITQPHRVRDMIESMLAIYQQQNMLPIWHLMGNDTECMVGYHAVPVIVDAYLKGFQGFDPTKAFDAMKASAMLDRKGVNYLKQIGYIPCDKVYESIAMALEYAIDDACIAQMARVLNRQEDYEYFLKRSKAYQKYFDQETQFMRGRMADGSWRSPFDPASSKHRQDDYCEGNAWQYTWLVPHDPEGLIALFGSESAFVQKLDQLFIVDSDLGEEASLDISGLIGQYAHGNEPSHHVAYLYAFAGRPWKTAQRVQHIMKTMYTDRPDGLCGNEDCGQMSAWYVFSAMGFYPVHPANGIYVLGSPAVKKAVVQAGAKPFVMEAVNQSEENIYIQSATYNGIPYTKGYITHQMIMDGGSLILKMGSNPNHDFAVDLGDRPKSTF
jgi:predicted alpha-1,2-mannosidase